MASAAVQHPSGHSTSFEPLATQVQENKVPEVQKHHVQTALNYYKDAGDGSPPPPSYVGKPETYERPVSPLDVQIYDVRGEEDKYDLDSHGFRFVQHESVEKDFRDEDLIKQRYYAEVEQLIKDQYVGSGLAKLARD